MRNRKSFNKTTRATADMPPHRRVPQVKFIYQDDGSASIQLTKQLKIMQGLLTVYGLSPSQLLAFAFRELEKQVENLGEMIMLLERFRVTPAEALPGIFDVVAQESGYFAHSKPEILSYLTDCGTIDPQTFTEKELTGVLRRIPHYQFPGDSVQRFWLPHVRAVVSGEVRRTPGVSIADL